MRKDTLITLEKNLQNVERIVIASHIRPDGDAIGSLLGLGFAFQDAGYSVQMVLRDGVPNNFRFLSGIDLVTKEINGEYDLSCAVDCSDLERTGGVFGDRQPDVNIDHHVTNTEYAKVNIIDEKSVSTTEIVYHILESLDYKISKETASVLLMGLITDTLGFRTSNMTPSALRTAANLMELGADLPYLYQESLVRRSYEAIKFWGLGLSKVQRDNGLIWTTLTMDDRLKVGYSGKDDADLINVLSSIEGADIAMIFVEQPSGNTKVSWRAIPGFDVSKIALYFGGGGHPAAAGAEIKNNINMATKTVLERTKAMLIGN